LPEPESDALGEEALERARDYAAPDPVPDFA